MERWDEDGEEPEPWWHWAGKYQWVNWVVEIEGGRGKYLSDPNSGQAGIQKCLFRSFCLFQILSQLVVSLNYPSSITCEFLILFLCLSFNLYHCALRSLSPFPLCVFLHPLFFKLQMPKIYANRHYIIPMAAAIWRKEGGEKNGKKQRKNNGTWYFKRKNFCVSWPLLYWLLYGLLSNQLWLKVNFKKKKQQKTRHLTIKRASTVPAQSEARQYIYIKRPLYVYPEQYI